MDPHRSFEFDRYPFDDAGLQEQLFEVLDDLQAYHATDITHGMETVEAHIILHIEVPPPDRP